MTGGAGFIGSNLCQTLLTQGNEVVVIDNFITSTGENLRDLRKHPHFRFIKHDVVKPFTLIPNSQFLIPDFIYHLACPTGVSNLKSLAEEMLLTSSLGTKNVLDLARQTKAAVLFTSSSEVYGDSKVFPQKEDDRGDADPTGLRSPYEEGKRFSEALVATYVRKYRLKAKIVRVFNTYGPGASLKDTRVMPRFIHLAQKGEPLIIYGRGSQTRTFCFIDDLVKGLILVAEKGKPGEVYNLGSDKEISIMNLAKLVTALTNSKSHLRFTNRPPHDHNRRLPSLEKIRKLGWQWTISLEEGIKKTLQRGLA